MKSLWSRTDIEMRRWIFSSTSNLVNFLDISRECWAVSEQLEKTVVSESGSDTSGTLSGSQKVLRTNLSNALSWLVFPEAFQVSTKQIVSFSSVAAGVQLFT